MGCYQVKLSKLKDDHSLREIERSKDDYTLTTSNTQQFLKISHQSRIISIIRDSDQKLIVVKEVPSELEDSPFIPKSL